ncbi:MAG: hypothetical protein PHF17_09345 [Arcobacteraceae bacterium]|nr:hypothetical protein [Arcobacteraceae bacterium]
MVKYFKILLFLLISLSFSGCFTGVVNQHKHYFEEIEHFGIINNHQILAISNKYNYLIDISPELKDILTSSYRKDLNITARFDSFEIKSHMKIEGGYTISYETEKYLPIDTENWFFNTGFTKKEIRVPHNKNLLKFHKKFLYTKQEKLFGKRYLLDANLTKQIKPEKFNKNYKDLYIYYDGAYENDEETRKLLTPIATVLDVASVGAVIAIYGLGFLGVGMIYTIGYHNFPYEIEGNPTISLYQKYNVKSKYELAVIK